MNFALLCLLPLLGFSTPAEHFGSLDHEWGTNLPLTIEDKAGEIQENKAHNISVVFDGNLMGTTITH